MRKKAFFSSIIWGSIAGIFATLIDMPLPIAIVTGILLGIVIVEYYWQKESNGR